MPGKDLTSDEHRVRATRYLAARAPDNCRTAAPSLFRHDRFDGQDFLPVLLCENPCCQVENPFCQVMAKYCPPILSSLRMAWTLPKAPRNRASAGSVPGLCIFEFSHIIERLKCYLRARGILSSNRSDANLRRAFAPSPWSRTKLIKTRNISTLTPTMHVSISLLRSVCSTGRILLANYPLQTASQTIQMGRIIRSRPIRFL